MQKKLASTKQWENLLFYRPQWLRPKKSFVISRDFFLSPDGEVNAEEELEASLRAFFKPEVPRSPDLPEQVNPHAQCQFPARFHWLSTQLGFDFTKMKKIRCELLEDLMTDLDPQSMSFVFSSAYLNNPASMFGHTFLRVHRKHDGKGTKAAMLDYAINFAAYPDTKQPLLYAFKGSTGAFPGFFDLMPYFMKVQEYSAAENRDLWEYELSLTPEQTKLVVLSLFEVARHRINYFYLDDNCALLMLVLLEIGNPNLNLTPHYNFWVIPADTVKTVVNEPGLVTRKHFRPSNLTKFIGRYKLLSSNESDTLKDILEAKTGDEAKAELDKFPKESRAKILDTALDYIDFKEKLTESNKPVLYANLRQPFLKMRAETQTASVESQEPPYQADPGLGHNSTRFGLSTGSSTKYGAFNRLEWRPALHDIMTPSLGYADELEIRFMDIDAQYNWDTKDLYLSRWQLFEVLSLAPLKPLLVDMSWRLSIGMETEVICRTQDRCYRKFFQWGGGVSIKPDPTILIYALGLVDIGTTNSEGQYFHGGPGVSAGMTWGITDNLKFGTYGSFLVHFGRTTIIDNKFGLEMARTFGPEFEIRLRAARYSDSTQGTLSLAKYF